MKKCILVSRKTLNRLQLEVTCCETYLAKSGYLQGPTTCDRDLVHMFYCLIFYGNKKVKSKNLAMTRRCEKQLGLHSRRVCISSAEKREREKENAKTQSKSRIPNHCTLLQCPFLRKSSSQKDLVDYNSTAQDCVKLCENKIWWNDKKDRLSHARLRKTLLSFST